MLLKIRKGDRLFEVEVPKDCRVVRSYRGRTVLLVPGKKPTDTCAWLPASEVLQAARQGEHGLTLLGDRSAQRFVPKAIRAQLATW